ncbi:MAG TPA: hypothetical protein PK710_16155, partial [Polyangiaceae bacterium]|nr:hypothetical protein [Polyangiaceae bacterium]
WFSSGGRDIDSLVDPDALSSSEEIAAGSYVDVLSGEVISVGDKPSAASWTLDSLRARVWVLESDPCR